MYRLKHFNLSRLTTIDRNFKPPINRHIFCYRLNEISLMTSGGYDLFIPGDGVWEIETKAIDCPTVPGKDGNIMFRFTGSNPWYVKLQARNIK